MEKESLTQTCSCAAGESACDGQCTHACECRTENSTCGNSCDTRCQHMWHTAIRRYTAHALIALVVVLTVMQIASLVYDFFWDPQNSVSISGRGTVSYAPDIATITVGVHVDRAASAEEALTKMNASIDAILAAIAPLGVNRSDIATQNYTVSPQYDYVDGVQKSAGFVADQSVLITVREIAETPDRVTQISNAASAAGANQILGIAFETKDPEVFKQEARIAALKDARSKAQAIADAAGVSLGDVTGWYETIIQSPDMTSPMPMPYYARGGVMMAETASAEPMDAKGGSVPAGTGKVIIEMSVNYEIR